MNDKLNIVFKESPMVSQPSSDTVLWRYMSLERFVSLLQKQALYFCRTDLFEDGFEGALPNETADLMDHIQRVEARRGLGPGGLGSKLAARRRYRKFFYANCWHACPHESMAMWKLYAPGGWGVALRTTVGALMAGIQNPQEGRIHSGLVSYVDFQSGLLDALGPIDSLFWKRLEYQHEREFRVLYQNFPNQVFDQRVLQVAETAAEIGGSFSFDPSMINWDIDTAPGHLLAVKLSAPNASVVLAPGVDDEVARAVNMAVFASGLGLQIERSALDSAPRF